MNALILSLLLIGGMAAFGHGIDCERKSIIGAGVGMILSAAIYGLLLLL